jgi:putative nucleotidyltransferase with HDIG domain
MYKDTDTKLRKIYDASSDPAKPIHKAYLDSIRSLVRLAERRDPFSRGHALKVSRYAVFMAHYLGLPKRDIDILKIAGILHDVGKIGVREKVLMKNASLTREEFEEVKKHTDYGVDVVKPLRFFKEIIPIIHHHHENYDGTGYPTGLKGEEIPLGARILAIVDVYDALTSTRAYRKAYHPEKVIKMMKGDSGKKFDPALLRAFFVCLSSIEREEIERKRK